jgi:hypothetical protein
VDPLIMIKRQFAFAVALIAGAIASPAVAQQTISFGGSNSFTDGADGNVRFFSAGGIKVQASAFSYDGNSLERAFLGRYSTGLGVTNNGEGLGLLNNSHTIDNLGQKDFVLLVFDRSVNIASAVLRPYDISSTANDNDAWVSYANFTGAYSAPTPTTLSLNSPLWASLAAVDYTVNGNMQSPYRVNLNSTGFYGNVWMLGAANLNRDTRDDGFKLSSIAVTNAPTPVISAVPEASTWAMMLFGFGGIGYSMRRSRGNKRLLVTSG